MTTKYKTFKEYYDKDPEFKKKHLENMKTKITCKCGFITSKANYYRHKKSHICILKREKMKKIEELEEEMKKLKKELKKLNKKNN
ncbi:MAG: hypothetical protein Satyrvirus11_27 [Satyrvirus sp.]|uniref:Uncharacterized protein n=1 Tax=Satyrvirus sp. TaxID=2487771 RepID=A0A3G5ADP8_9VIRU|nr:MAG: hypothetical protein Satyrvirus11_27 [Satyrvirus sp.]